MGSLRGKPHFGYSERHSSGQKRRRTSDRFQIVVSKRPKLDHSYGRSKNTKSIATTTTTTTTMTTTKSALPVPRSSSCKQFWKAGDYEGLSISNHPTLHSSSFSSPSTGMEHARVHPKFLHSNATSHKWALGAFAELLDNALDEVCNGATYVKVDMLIDNKVAKTMSIEDRHRSKMLLIQDNGGGMRPDKMRSCMSLGYSSKTKLANTIGQYGNGFKTSTMRLGADVIVFSSCKAKDRTCPTRSIGMLSYTFLKSTKKEDTVVPMIDYENKGQVWTKMIRTTSNDWNLNLDTITQWSPFSTELELLHQFDYIGNQGTRIIIYNLWEDDMQQLELDFDTDPHDIQIRGVNRDKKKIAMAEKYPNSRHYLTFQHSLRSYASILYLRLPPGFRINLRGKNVEHHNLANDMVYTKEVLYKPVPITDGTVKDSNATPKNIQVMVTLGFVKDAKDHIDIQGFNIYHKNRLIKPFWRVWNAAGSDGRGVIGLLEADFVEPAHDKQGFEKTTALSRLESRLLNLQKSYWRENCHMIGYAPRRALNKSASETVLKLPSGSNTPNGKVHKGDPSKAGRTSIHFKTPPSRQQSYSSIQMNHPSTKYSRPVAKDCLHKFRSEESNAKLNTFQSVKGIGKLNAFQSERNNDQFSSPGRQADIIARLTKENHDLKKRLQDANESRRVNELQQQLQAEKEKFKSLETNVSAESRRVNELQHQLQAGKEKFKSLETNVSAESTRVNELQQQLQAEKEQFKSLETKLDEANKQNNQLVNINKEKEAMIKIFANARELSENEVERLGRRLRDALRTIEDLLEKARRSERKHLDTEKP